MGKRYFSTITDVTGEPEPQEILLGIATALASQVAHGKRRAIVLEEVDGQPVHDSPLAPAHIESEFVRTNHG